MTFAPDAYARDCASRVVLDRIGDRWTVLVVGALAGGRLRFSELRARVEGNDVGYGTIAASGPHACVLHWTHNNGEVRAGELLLLDAGVEGNSLYTADITRTLPVSGKFSP